MLKTTLTAGLLLATVVTAQAGGHHHGHHTHHDMHGVHNHHGAPHMRMRTQTDKSPSTKEYLAANVEMHHGMDFKYSGDADIDFLKAMIAHHKGAVDMSETVMKYGEDSRVNRMAWDIIRNQKLEIKWMENWLASLEGKRPQAVNHIYNDVDWLGEHDARIFE